MTIIFLQAVVVGIVRSDDVGEWAVDGASTMPWPTSQTLKDEGQLFWRVPIPLGFQAAMAASGALGTDVYLLGVVV